MTPARPLTTRHLPPPVPDVVIEHPEPLVDDGRFPAKAIVGDPLDVAADCFAHGHSIVRAGIRHRRVGARAFTEEPLSPVGNDRYEGSVTPRADGPFELEFVAEVDALATAARDAARRLGAGRPDPNDSALLSGLVGEAAARLGGIDDQSATRCYDLAREIASGLHAAHLEALDALAGPLQRRRYGEQAATLRTKGFASRPKAAFSAWYELFPRSASPDPARPGTLRDVIGRLDYVADLGFDVLYLPPIHPIGTTARKGRNNSVTAAPGDVGSPWAIGGLAGGHDAVAPELGTVDDLAALVAAAAERGIEVALDLAFQCSPDHPWVAAHPDWFAHRPDGTIACAENPPKRYEDIYPLDFATADREGLWQALAEVVAGWCRLGVRIFRVDNPHTKPFAFWEWLLAQIKRETPGVLFLAEAFTRPKVMHRLAKAGFDQSYTYFAWRDSKWELEEYARELTTPPSSTSFRPNLWPNTPDILAKSLQHGGRASFLARLVLAACLSSSYGIYGPAFELLVDTPVAPGSEEYLDSEKYEVHHHDLDDPRSIRRQIAAVNAARRAHPALQRNEQLAFHRVENDQLICWSKRSRDGDCVLVVVNLDPEHTQAGLVEVDPIPLGLAEGEQFTVVDLLGGEEYRWRTGPNYVSLDPARLPAHLFALRRHP